MLLVVFSYFFKSLVEESLLFDFESNPNVRFLECVREIDCLRVGVDD
jgi:hypothetical protein